MTTIPAKGEVFTFSKRTGYVLVQNRPLDCRRGCAGHADGSSCNGRGFTSELEVAEVIGWADGAVEVVSEPDADGNTWRNEVRPCRLDF